MICAPNVKHIERGERGTTVLYIGFELSGGTKLPQGVFASPPGTEQVSVSGQ